MPKDFFKRALEALRFRWIRLHRAASDRLQSFGRWRRRWTFELYFCGAPVGYGAVVAAALRLFPDNFSGTTVLGAPADAFLVFGVMVAAAVAGWSYFHSGVRDGVAVASLLSVSFLLILLFAAIFAREGVMCSAAACPGAERMRETAQFGAQGDPGRFIEVYASAGTALYFAVVTFTTLGYGDLQPMPEQRLFAAALAMAGYLVLGMLVGLLIDWGNDFRTREAHEDRRDPPG
ncbi:potassium channel family protein [Rhodovulum sp. DZ06]|uniref:potassium channel family protein n=1 Tax=Rhodovulum sp. DZ06 TaxID=3425126 RepID=UPI003D33D257